MNENHTRLLGKENKAVHMGGDRVGRRLYCGYRFDIEVNHGPSGTEGSSDTRR